MRNEASFQTHECHICLLRPSPRRLGTPNDRGMKLNDPKSRHWPGQDPGTPVDDAAWGVAKLY